MQTEPLCVGMMVIQTPQSTVVYAK